MFGSKIEQFWDIGSEKAALDTSATPPSRVEIEERFANFVLDTCDRLGVPAEEHGYAVLAFVLGYRLKWIE